MPVPRHHQPARMSGIVSWSSVQQIPLGTAKGRGGSSIPHPALVATSAPHQFLSSSSLALCIESFATMRRDFAVRYSRLGDSEEAASESPLLSTNSSTPASGWPPHSFCASSGVLLAALSLIVVLLSTALLVEISSSAVCRAAARLLCTGSSTAVVCSVPLACLTSHQPPPVQVDQASVPFPAPHRVDLDARYNSSGAVSSSGPSWAALPRLTLICRTYFDTLDELWRFFFSYGMHWPYIEWRTNIVFVLDADSASDRILAAVLVVAYRMFNVSIFLESSPPPGTLSGNMRHEGYSRTQWSNFYSDLYVPADVDYIGIFDADTQIPYRPNPDDLFNTRTGKPLMRGLGERTPFCPSAEFMTGGVCAGDFMVTFPFIVKRAHFPLMRAHITAHTQSASFEQAWYKMQTQYPPWGNFVVMGNYLWHYHHSEYDWRLFRMRRYNASDPNDAFAFRYDRPTVYAGKHLVMENNTVTARQYLQQICVQSRYEAADCADYRDDATMHDMARLSMWTHGWPLAGQADSEAWAAENNAHREDWRLWADTANDINWHQYGGREVYGSTTYDRARRTIAPSFSRAQAEQVLAMERADGEPAGTDSTGEQQHERHLDQPPVPQRMTHPAIAYRP